ncbi:hypothetical protein TNCV_5045691 [Trichonephila clavipes]|uniref:Uncharacterized protein n=1 Tax=Trichonephila clavipes TaxID=2585209 RepID=A0A8X6WHZ0_TRICX|nr:hypothetical protein TNCV_5045691 [Trichonephila clavipes]
MAAVDFLHHENLPTWAGVAPATLGAEGQRQTNHATQPALSKKILVQNLSKANNSESVNTIYTAGQLLRTDNTIIHSNHKMKGSKMWKIRISAGY